MARLILQHAVEIQQQQQQQQKLTTSNALARSQALKHLFTVSTCERRQVGFTDRGKRRELRRASFLLKFTNRHAHHV
jgi:hypothetical protein